jgi:hypothetical protein
MEIKLLQNMGVTFFTGIPFHLCGSKTNEDRLQTLLVDFKVYENTTRSKRNLVEAAQCNIVQKLYKIKAAVGTTFLS